MSPTQPAAGKFRRGSGRLLLSWVPMTWARLAAVVLLVLCAGTAGAGLPTVTHEGRSYVELTRVAESLKSRLEATADEHARPGCAPATKVVTLTRNWARVLVDGTPMVLDAPVRVQQGRVARARVVRRPRSCPSSLAAATTPATRGSRPRAPAASRSTLEDLRLAVVSVVHPRSSSRRRRPSPIAWSRAGPGSAHPAARPERRRPGRGDRRRPGRRRSRLERAGADRLLRVIFEGAAGDAARSARWPIRPGSCSTSPGRSEPAARDGQGSSTPLRTIVLDAGHGGHDSGAVGPDRPHGEGAGARRHPARGEAAWRSASASRCSSRATPTTSSRCATAPASPTASAPICSCRFTPTRIA